MPKEQNANLALIQQVTKGIAGSTPADNDDDQQAAPVAPAAQQSASAPTEVDDVPVIPKAPEKEPKAPKRTAEESHGILRQQRDEARQRAAELEQQLQASANQGKVYDKLKALIKKDEITDADLEAAFNDYDLTKREKDDLEKRLKETQTKLREYDITTSPDFQAQYLTPFQESQQALAAEIMPIVNDAPVQNAKAGAIIKHLLENNITDAVKIKAALNNIRDAYEEDGVEFVMPTVVSVQKSLKAVQTNMQRINQAVETWEQDKAARQAEQQELAKSKGILAQGKSRKERTVITTEFMKEFINTDDYDFLSEELGHDGTMNPIVSSHNELTEVMDDPSKAPDYKVLLTWHAKAKLFDEMMNLKKKSGKMALAVTKKAQLDNIGQKTTQDKNTDTNPNKELLRQHGVKI